MLRFRKLILCIVNVIFVLYTLDALRCKLIIPLWWGQKLYIGWGTTEFMINYQGGYVRRGLLGEVLYNLSGWTHINPIWFIDTIMLVCFIVIISIFVRWIVRYKVSWWILPLSFVFGGLDFCRKDLLCLLLVMAIISVLNKESMNRWLRYAALNLIAILLWNMHEAFFFVIGPFMMYYLLFKDKTFRSLTARCLGILPQLIAAALVFICKGNLNVAEDIYASWHAYYPDAVPLLDTSVEYSVLTEPANSIVALGWDTWHTLANHINFVYGKGVDATFLNESYPQPLGVFIMPLLYLVILFVVSRWPYRFSRRGSVFHGVSCNAFTLLLIFQFVSMIPMFFGLSCDVSRYCAYWTLSSLAILFTIGQNKVDTMFPQWFVAKTARFNNCADVVLGNGKNVILLIILFIGVPGFYYSIVSILPSGVFVNVMTTISKIICKLF